MQSLSDPLFAVPFLLNLGFGLFLVGIGLFIHRRYRDDAGDRARRVAHVGAVLGFCSFGFVFIAIALYYAGRVPEVASLREPAGPSLIGRVGLTLPWIAVAEGFAVLFAATTAVAVVAGVYDQYGDALR